MALKQYYLEKLGIYANFNTVNQRLITDDGVIYKPEEINSLLGATTDMIKIIHQIKSQFKGQPYEKHEVQASPNR